MFYRSIFTVSLKRRLLIKTGKYGAKGERARGRGSEGAREIYTLGLNDLF